MEGDSQSPSTSRGNDYGTNGDTFVHTFVEDFNKEVKEAGGKKGKSNKLVRETSFYNDNGAQHRPQTATDKERMDAGRQALRELLKERKQTKQKKASFISLIRLYVTIVAALCVIGGLMVLLFLIPMTIDPALATINYDIEENPSICLTLYSLRARRIDALNSTNNPFWCSCSEGCTKDLFICNQIVVAYRKKFLSLDKDLQGGFNKTAYFSKIGIEIPGFVDEINDTRLSSEVNSDCQFKDWIYNPKCWDSLNASLLVNIKGCGYPPEVNCDTFLQSYNKTGRRFLCYYSRLDPRIVIVNYDPNKAWEDIYWSLGWTFGAQVVGSIVIIILHFPFKSTLKLCLKKSKKST